VRLCFIVEEEYRDTVMPLAVARELTERGHHVDVLEPQETVTPLSSLTRYGYGAHDAYVLKTVSDGPGLSLLEAAAAVGIATINNARAVRLARDKAVAAAFARRHGIAFPVTYFVAHVDLLRTIPHDQYPLVVKPSNGSSMRDVFRVETPADLGELMLSLGESGDRFYLAQPYIENAGIDIKLYNTGDNVFAVLKRSPLSPDAQVAERLIRLPRELDELARLVGRTFGLDIYGIDVVESPSGWIVLDVNDFPSFGMVPDAAKLMANTIERIAYRAAAERQESAIRRGVHVQVSPPAAESA
jgi:ribosomal protein S6--L-glutamate ligase